MFIQSKSGTSSATEIEGTIFNAPSQYQQYITSLIPQSILTLNYEEIKNVVPKFDGVSLTSLKPDADNEDEVEVSLKLF